MEAFLCGVTHTGFTRLPRMVLAAKGMRPEPIPQPAVIRARESGVPLVHLKPDAPMRAVRRGLPNRDTCGICGELLAQTTRGRSALLAFQTICSGL